MEDLRKAVDLPERERERESSMSGMDQERDPLDPDLNLIGIQSSHERHSYCKLMHGQLILPVHFYAFLRVQYSVTGGQV